MSMSSSSPSTIISEALSAFSRSANLALNAAASEEATRANARIHELRKERDDANQKAYDAEMEIERWKSAAAKAEFTISHQTETLAQLTRDAQQWQEQSQHWQGQSQHWQEQAQHWQDQSQHWQTQCHHVSETSRRDIQDWKDQFLHAERERVRLMDRLDELIKAQQSQLVPQRRPQTPHPHTPNPKTLYPTPHIDVAAPGPSTNRRDSIPSAPYSSSESTLTHEHGPPEDPVVDRRKPAKTPVKPASTLTAKGKQKASAQAPTTNGVSTRTPRTTQARPQSTAQPQMQTTPRTQVIRRVQAVVEIPIKSEDDDDEEAESALSASVSAPAPTPRRTNVSANGRARQSSKRGNQQRVEESGESEYDDWGDNDDRDGDYREDDDDELMLGGGNDNEDVSGIKQSKKRRRSTAVPNNSVNRSATRRRHQ